MEIIFPVGGQPYRTLMSLPALPGPAVFRFLKTFMYSIKCTSSPVTHRYRLSQNGFCDDWKAPRCSGLVQVVDGSYVVHRGRHR